MIVNDIDTFTPTIITFVLGFRIFWIKATPVLSCTTNPPKEHAGSTSGGGPPPTLSCRLGGCAHLTELQPEQLNILIVSLGYAGLLILKMDGGFFLGLKWVKVDHMRY